MIYFLWREIVMNQRLERVKQAQKKRDAFRYASAVMMWDAQTGAPKSGSESRGHVLQTFGGYAHELLVNKQMDEDLSALMQSLDTLTPIEQSNIQKLKKEYDRLMSIPKEEYMAYIKLENDAVTVWETARESSDWPAFMPYLKEMVAFKIRFAEYIDSSRPAYDVLVDEYEEGMTTELLDDFFETLRSRIVPLLQQITESDDYESQSFLKQEYAVDAQKELSNQLLDVIGFDRSKGYFRESAHPFTMGLDIHDVRLTTRYESHDVLSSIYSTIHEGGHAIYEQNVEETLMGTQAGLITSLGMHESQSRFYENYVGRSDTFIKRLLSMMRPLFPEQLEGIDDRQAYRAFNHVSPSLIRIEADELTYALHIMVRYEIEKGLINGTMNVEDLPNIWNEKMQEYLGVSPSNDAEGVLQDTHWASGLIGYFPTYALGTAYAAQFLHAMKKEVDFEGCIAQGDLTPIREWLTENIHQYGSLYTSTELIKKATKESFNPNYFCDYLEEKYKSLYHL